MVEKMKNWLVLGGGGRPGTNFRVGYTWGPSGYPEFLKKYSTYRKAKHRFEICVKFVI
jgi:hypothetical protein